MSGCGTQKLWPLKTTPNHTLRSNVTMGSSEPYSSQTKMSKHEQSEFSAKITLSKKHIVKKKKERRKHAKNKALQSFQVSEKTIRRVIDIMNNPQRYMG